MLTLTVENPNTLSQADLNRLDNVLWDVLSRESGMGELARCDHCQTLFSKESYFLSRSGVQACRTELVSDLFQQYSNPPYSCIHCDGSLGLIQPPKTQDCLEKSIRTTIVTCRNSTDTIVGGLLTYVTSLETAYRREFIAHYGKDGLHALGDTIHEILGYIPEKWHVFSSIGLMQMIPQQHLFLRNMLRTWSHHELSQEDRDTPGIAEMDENNSFFRIYSTLGLTPINLGISPKNTSPNYKSRIMYHPYPVRELARKTTTRIRGLISSYHHL